MCAICVPRWLCSPLVPQFPCFWVILVLSIARRLLQLPCVRCSMCARVFNRYVCISYTNIRSYIYVHG